MELPPLTPSPEGHELVQNKRAQTLYCTFDRCNSAEKYKRTDTVH